MSFGIGLGAFVDGLEQGQRLRANYDAQKEAKANKAALAGIETDTKAAFDGAVQSGEQSPDSFDEFWTKYALPKRKAEMLRQGDVRGAQALDEWGQSQEARAGGRLFGSAMVKAQTGDAGGAIDDAIKAAQTKGYMDGGFELVGKDEIKEGDKVLGYRLKIKTATGETVEQDVAAGDVGRIVATFANPDAAWQSQVTSREKAAKAEAEQAEEANKRANGLEDYEAKKKIDQQYEKPDKDSAQKDYLAAKKTLLENDLDFAGKTPEEQDAQTRQYLEGAKKYANPEPAAAAPVAAAPGLGGAGAAPVAGPRLRIDTVTGQPAPAESSQTAPDEKSALLSGAVAQLQGGADPAKVRQALAASGISEDELLAAMKTKAKRFGPYVPKVMPPSNDGPQPFSDPVM